MPHGVEFGLGLLPFLLLDAVGQQSAAGIQSAGIPVDMHTAKGDEEVGTALQTERPHESTVVAALAMLVVEDKAKGLLLG